MKHITLWLLVFCSLNLNAEAVVYDSDQFRLYTFDENKHMQAELVATIQQAYDAFEFYFDLPTKAITVVAYPDVAMMQTIDLKDLDSRGKVLPFLIEPQQSYRASQPEKEHTVMLLADLGLQVKQMQNTLVVESVLQPIIMLNGLTGIQVGDQLVGLNETPLTDLNNLSGLVDALNNGDAFTLRVNRENKTSSLTGKKLNLKTTTQKQNKELDQDQNSSKDELNIMLGALQHEIGHMLLIGYMDDDLLKSQKSDAILSSTDDVNPKQTYGSLKTPDWLDELVANMCESRLVKTMHKKAIKQTSDLMPLTTLLTTRHPSMDSIINSKAFQDKRKKGVKTQAIVLTMDDFNDEERAQILTGTGTFYGSSLLFGEYLYHKGGSQILKNIIEKVRAEGNVPFSELINNHQSLANSIADVEQDFHRFVELTMGKGY